MGWLHCKPDILASRLLQSPFLDITLINHVRCPTLLRYRSFNEAKKFVHGLVLKSQKEWYDYCKSKKKPADIPTMPHRVYKDEWQGLGDWVGTGRVATHQREYRSFDKAKEFVHSLHLSSREEWLEYCRSGNKPQDIPNYPTDVYKEKWIDWADWLGIDDGKWDVQAVKELVRELIKSKIIYQWDEAVLYSLLLRKGVLNLTANRHKHFFKNLIAASRTDEGKKMIEDYVNSDLKEPPDISKIAKNEQFGSEEREQEIQTASSIEVARLIDESDPLDYGEVKTAEQILAQTQALESVNVDEEAIQFYLDYSIEELWKTAFRGEKETLLKVKQEGKNGNKYHDTVVETFLSDYEGTKNTKIPEGYAFPYEPTLMQRYVAYKVKTNPYFGNFSGTGAGKTLSAVLASRVIDSKMTAIVCPNDVVVQWQKSISEIFPDSKVITGKEAFYAKYDENGRLSTLRDVLKEEGFEIYQDEPRGEFTFIEAREL